ncbi:hypothetical protein AIOL_004471 [Candidatus Rhodobacter oscarellae]|uniref:DUF2029 domain-containing protein n=2 Tax=Candidatus Rhodobacter oscarellae TaxID=1675527 RepID=A0A0J9ECN9_9RHOB|nr:hypothetical protein AIOL_004471 [Candidatus Rhodobacter lobularis]
MLLVFLGVVIAGLGGAALMKGGFYIAKHEGDTLHLLQILFRMADGEWPHLDFMTPIGIAAFQPVVWFLDAGMGVGQAILSAQVVVACALLLPTVWAAFSRFPNGLAYLFGLTVMVLALALVHGERDLLVSISMHYNRWAWAVAYVVIVLAVLPGVVVRSGVLDGGFIGLGMAFLALCKVTYFISFAPVVLIALLLRRDWVALICALVAGLAVMAAVTAEAGVAFWGAYLGDLLAVAGSEVRSQPGMPLQSVIGAPAYLGGSLVVLLGVVLLRQAGEAHLGLLLLLLAGGFFYVTFQNFGNDPQWLVLLAILLLAPRVDEKARNGFGWPLGRALMLSAVAALAFATPSFINLAYSPFRHMNVNPEKYTPLLADSGPHRDLHGRIVRANRVDGTMGLDGPGSGLEGRAELADRETTKTEFLGELLPDCELRMGIIAWFEVIAADLEANGFGDTKIYTADIFSSLWLFGDNPRLVGGSPWYYGGLPGIADASHLLVPLCPASEAIRKQALEAVAARALTVEEVHRHGLYILAEIKR